MHVPRTILLAPAAATLLAACSSGLGLPGDWTYRSGAVTIGAAAPVVAVVCESETNGIEVRYGDDGDAMFVQAGADGVDVVWESSTSRTATSRVTVDADAQPGSMRLEATFDDETAPVGVTYESVRVGECDATS
jgi:hypothetical protein